MRSAAYTALIVDDEEYARDMIALLLADHFPNIEVVDKVGGVEAACESLRDHQPDVIFLDVEIGDGSGFDVLKRLPALSSAVIFVTAYEKYAIRAIRAAALDYLLKPLNREEFKTAVNKALRRLPSHRNHPSPDHTQGEHDVRKLGIPSLTGISFVEVDSIVRCQAENNYSWIFFENGAKTLVSYTLSTLEEKLRKFGFMRIHHKHLISLSAIDSYQKGKGGGAVVLKDNSVANVSVRKKAELMKILLVQGN